MVTLDTETLIEREEASEVVDEVTASAGRADGSVAVIEAMAGLGKTALLSRARERAASAGMTVAAARGAELERDFSFGVVRQLLERVVAGATASERADLLSGSARPAALALGLDDPAWADRADAVPGRRAATVMHGLYWLVVNLAERGPMVVIVDDAHVADAASLRWLHYLVRRLDGLPVAVLVTTRPREPGADWQTLEAIAAEPHVRAVRLAPLTQHGAANLVRRLLGGAADDEFCAACHMVTGGNPFLLRELTEALARDGVGPTTASVTKVHELVPEAVTRSVILRMARLPEVAGRLAQATAVLGSGAPIRDAAALAELDADSAARGADALARAGILSPGLPLEFVHPLLHAAVLDDLPAAERAVHHARAARVVASGGAGADVIAAHLLRAQPAGDPWAVERLREAAAEALARGDPRSAIALLRRAYDEPVPTKARVPLLQELLQASFIAMDSSALDALDADVEAEVAADPLALQQSAMPVMLSLYFRGRQQEALTVLERSVATAAQAGDVALALRLEARWITFAQVLPSEAVRRLEPYAGRVEPGTFAGRLLDATSAWFESFMGRSAAETSQRARRALADGRLVAELQDDDWVLGTCVYTLVLTDELELAERLIGHILELGRARGSASAVAGGSFLSASVARHRGNLVRAEGDAETAVRAFGEAGIVASLPTMTALLVDTLIERGRLGQAATELAATGMDADVPPLWWCAPVLWSRAKLRLAQGRTREGVDDLLEHGRRAGEARIGGSLSYPWASYAAPCLYSLGAEADALEIAERELRVARAWGTPRAIGQALRALGLVTAGSPGIELLRESVETLARSPARLEHARALIDLGATLRRSNRRSDARPPLRAGLDMAHRCGAEPLADRAMNELRATGAKPRKAVLTGVEALTASERRIAEMASEGRTNREIAQALFVTIKTVETHLGHTFQKLSVNSRSELGPLLAGRPS
jgi:DNA-binding CsgD family transcriptional regulator